MFKTEHFHKAYVYMFDKRQKKVFVSRTLQIYKQKRSTMMTIKEIVVLVWVAMPIMKQTETTEVITHSLNK